MRTRLMLGVALAGISTIGPLAIVPSGAGQQYGQQYAANVRQFAEAAGRLIPRPGGRQQSVEQTAAQPAAVRGSVFFIDGLRARLLGLKEFPLGIQGPEFGTFFYGCITVRGPLGADKGCVQLPLPPPGNVVLPGVATINFQAPSQIYQGGVLTAHVLLTGRGPARLVPILNLRIEPAQNDYRIQPGLVYAQNAISNGTITSSRVGGGVLLNGQGSMATSATTTFSSCQGPCVEQSQPPDYT